jgi:UDP-N-acetylglucosamine 2-epimerase (non-hydrolysing)
MIRILLVFGTRPEAIKMAPLVKILKKDDHNFITKVCVTAQHRQMLDQVLDFFEIIPDYDLNLMKPNQDLYNLTSDILLNMKYVLDDFNPNYVFVHGDTTTSTITALAAFYKGIKVCHIEAGLRTNDKYSPFPEEINRQITARIADFHFAPTLIAKNNLIKEGISENKIKITGNTVIDALLYSKDKVDKIVDPEIELLKLIIKKDVKIILITGHRRENFGDGFINICSALNELSKFKNVQIIYPVHLNPNVQEPVFNVLGKNPNINLISPLGYPAFVWLMKRAYIILTDSGGIQEEAPSLGKPVLVMRNTTERPEAVEAGTVILVGTDVNKIINECEILLNNNDLYLKRSMLHNPYGSGDSSNTILNFILNEGK